METLPLELTNLVLDFVAFEDKASLIQLSSASSFYRHLIAPRIFRKLAFKDFLVNVHLDVGWASQRIQHIIEFARASKWANCVESTDLEMRLPDLESRESRAQINSRQFC